MSSRSLRSIPAWAGETPIPGPGRYPTPVYPRVGGGNAAGGGYPFPAGGLSPRGRGKRPRRRSLFSQAGSIPAWAGETPGPGTPGCSSRVYPRVGGGNPLHRRIPAFRDGLSPRGRGKLQGPLVVLLAARSIPAWAGETGGRYLPDYLIRVYPRVGGGNLSALALSGPASGLSPRGRGKPAGKPD